MTTVNKHETKFLRAISAEPGIAAEFLPRAKRGETLRHLEMTGLIHYGPGGWFITEAGTAALEVAS